jgi:hypothetical protein
LYAIASEIASTDFRVLPNNRFGRSNGVRVSSMKVNWRREQLDREQGTMTCCK